jgi:hypothetical protein
MKRKGEEFACSLNVPSFFRPKIMEFTLAELGEMRLRTEQKIERH